MSKIGQLVELEDEASSSSDATITASSFLRVSSTEVAPGSDQLETASQSQLGSEDLWPDNNSESNFNSPQLYVNPKSSTYQTTEFPPTPPLSAEILAQKYYQEQNMQSQLALWHSCQERHERLAYSLSQPPTPYVQTRKPSFEDLSPLELPPAAFDETPYHQTERDGPSSVAYSYLNEIEQIEDTDNFPMLPESTENSDNHDVDWDHVMTERITELQESDDGINYSSSQLSDHQFAETRPAHSLQSSLKQHSYPYHTATRKDTTFGPGSLPEETSYDVIKCKSPGILYKVGDNAVDQDMEEV